MCCPGCLLRGIASPPAYHDEARPGESPRAALSSSSHSHPAYNHPDARPLHWINLSDKPGDRRRAVQSTIAVQLPIHQVSVGYGDIVDNGLIANPERLIPAHVL